MNAMTTTVQPVMTQTRTQSMQAIVQRAYGAVDVLQLGAIDRPMVGMVGARQVLLKVHAAGMDRGTWHLMTGRPYLMRLMGFGFSRPKNPIAGLDVAGTVIAVGTAVSRFKVGDAVFGIGEGSFAEFSVAREDKLAHKPPSLSFEQAAVCGVSALTALQTVRDAARIEAGQRVLIIGASGGVGSFAVQVAKALGAEVTGVCSTTKMELVRSLGADHVIDYRTTDVTEGTQKYDVILDLGGNVPLSRLRRVLTDRGALVFVGGEHGGDWSAGFGRPIGAMILGRFVKQRFVMIAAKEHFSDLVRIATLIDQGKVRPVIDQTFALRDVPAAMRRLEAGLVAGKIAIHVA